MVKFIKPALNVCMPPVLTQLFTTVQVLPYMTGCRTSFTRLYNCTLDKGLTAETSLDAQGFPLKKVDCGNCIDCPFFMRTHTINGLPPHIHSIWNYLRNFIILWIYYFYWFIPSKIIDIYVTRFPPFLPFDIEI